MNVTGMLTTNGNSIFSVTVPDNLSIAVDSMSLGEGILLFVVVLIGAIFIVVSTIGVLLTVYGRLFNLYLMIAISPLPIATAIGKPTRFVFYNFVTVRTDRNYSRIANIPKLKQRTMPF